MTRGGLRIFSIAGIPVRVHWTLLVMLPLLAVAFGQSFVRAAALADVSAAQVSGRPWLWGLALAVALFASVVVHELAHVLYARAKGGHVLDITLWMLGGVSRMTEPPARPRHEAMMAFVGPLASFGIAIVAFAVAFLFGRESFTVQFGFFYLAQLNLVLGVFNLLPAFPMDGGRILRALLAMRLGRRRATRIASIVGKVFAAVFVVLGLFSFNLLLLLVGYFVYVGASVEVQGVRLQEDLGGIRVSRVMSERPVAVEAAAPLADAARRMKDARRIVLPVLEAGRVIGVITFDDVRRVPPDAREGVNVRESVRPVAPLSADTETFEALRRLDEEGVTELPVVADQVLVGTIGREDIARGLVLHELDEERRSGRPGVIGAR
jgi:Zn-dependent protease/CBS domain-containing protein